MMWFLLTVSLIRDQDLFILHILCPIGAPSFHLVLDTCTRGEVYNMAIR